MDFVEVVEVLDNSNLVRNCTLFKSSDLMQKTINYINSSSFAINLNGETFNDINQLFFIYENDLLYLYANTQIKRKSSNIKKIPLKYINYLEVIV